MGLTDECPGHGFHILSGEYCQLGGLTFSKKTLNLAAGPQPGGKLLIPGVEVAGFYGG